MDFAGIAALITALGVFISSTVATIVVIARQKKIENTVKSVDTTVSNLDLGVKDVDRVIQRIDQVLAATNRGATAVHENAIKVDRILGAVEKMMRSFERATVKMQEASAQIQKEVSTRGPATLAEFADKGEGRRVAGNIPIAQRTTQEQDYVDALGNNQDANGDSVPPTGPDESHTADEPEPPHGPGR